MPRLSFAALLFACTGIAACAVQPAPAAPPAPGSEWRVMVKLAEPSADPRQIAEQASRVSGVSVQHVAASSPQWHALVLACADEAACDAAMQRLRAAAATYASVQRDQRRQPQSP
jgi:hypothetical protein